MRNTKRDGSDNKLNIFLKIAIILIVGVALDIFVNVTQFASTYVSEAYLEYIFSAIVTIAVLSFTIIALIANALNKIYFGYELKEIINFKTSSINIKNFIRVSMVNVTLATFLLTLSFKTSCVNTLICVLIAIIIYVLDIGLKIYRILTSDEYCRQLVIENYKSISSSNISLVNYQNNLKKLSIAWSETLNNRAIDDKNIIIKMLCDLNKYIVKKKNIEINEFYKYFHVFFDVLKENVVHSSLQIGYVETVKDIVELYSSIEAFKQDRQEVLLLPFGKIEFYNDEKLKSINYLSQILDLEYMREKEKLKKLTNDEIQAIYYYYFKNIFENKICLISTKQDLIETYLFKISQFPWNSEQKLTNEQRVILKILNQYVFRNESIVEREFIYSNILKSIYLNNLYNNDNAFNNILSLIFQAFYAYIYLEEEVLTKEYREQIKELFQKGVITPTISELSFGILAKQKIKGIINAIGKRIESNDETGLIFEYHTLYPFVKTSIWTKEFDMKFIFLLYLVYHDTIGFYSPYNSFFSWNNIENNKKIEILNVYLEFFDLFNSRFTTHAYEESKQLSELLNETFKFDEYRQETLLEHIMEEKRKLYEIKVNQINYPDINVENIKETLDELMLNDKIFGWSTEPLSEFYIEEVKRDSVCRKEYFNDNTAVRNIQNSIIHKVNQYIDNYSDKLSVSFNEYGVKEMLEFVKGCKYNTRNYTFTDDLAFSKTTKESSDFKELVSLNEKTKLLRTPGIRSYIFFNEDKFRFTITLLQCEPLPLSEEECIEFIQGSKTYNGLYNIDGTLMVRSQAISMVKRLFCKEGIRYKLIINMGHSDIICIKFKY